MSFEPEMRDCANCLANSIKCHLLSSPTNTKTAADYLEALKIMCVLAGDRGEGLGVQGLPGEAVWGGHGGGDGVSGGVPDTV